MNTKIRLSRGISQFLSAFAIAAGIGLLVAGSSLYPCVPPHDIGQALSSLRWSARDAQLSLELAASLKGSGAGVLTLGILGLVIPWVNTLMANRKPTADASGSASNAA